MKNLDLMPDLMDDIEILLDRYGIIAKVHILINKKNGNYLEFKQRNLFPSGHFQMISELVQVFAWI